MLAVATVHESEDAPQSGQREVAKLRILASTDPKREAADEKTRRWLRMGVARFGVRQVAKDAGLTHQRLSQLMSEVAVRGTSLAFRDLLLMRREVARPMLLLALAEVDAALPRGVSLPLLLRVTGIGSLCNDLVSAWAAGGGTADATSPDAALAMLATCDRLTDEVTRLRAQLAPLAREASK